MEMPENVQYLVNHLNALLAKAETVFDSGSTEDWATILMLSLELKLAYAKFENASGVAAKAAAKVKGYLLSGPRAKKEKVLSKKTSKTLAKQLFSIRVTDRASYHFTVKPKKKFYEPDGVLVIELTSKTHLARSFCFYDQKRKTLYFVRSHAMQRLNERLFDRQYTGSQAEAYFFHHIVRAESTKVVLGTGYEYRLIFERGETPGTGFSFSPSVDNNEPKIGRVKDYRQISQDEETTSFNMVSLNTFIPSSTYSHNQLSRAAIAFSFDEEFVDLGSLAA